MKFSILILAALIASAIASSRAQGLYFKKPNRMKDGQRHGLWVSYTDSTKNIPEWKGKFKNGNEKGTWKYYHPNGTIRKKEKYRLHKIKTRTYYPNGQLESAGSAKIDESENKLEYYYWGPWKYYSETGKLIRIAFFEKGNLVREEIVP